MYKKILPTALSGIAKDWKQPWDSQIMYIHTIEYYTDIITNEEAP